MFIKALIVDQLDDNGRLRSVLMQSATDGVDLVVEFPHVYDATHAGPFHFQSQDHEREFGEAFAEAQERKLLPPYFERRYDGTYHVTLSWLNVPTVEDKVSYYALVLPENAIPARLSIHDKSKAQYPRLVLRDDTRWRFIIYVEMKQSGRKTFDILVECDFQVGMGAFTAATYQDDWSASDPYALQFILDPNGFRTLISPSDARKIDDFQHLPPQISAQQVTIVSGPISIKDSTATFGGNVTRNDVTLSRSPTPPVPQSDSKAIRWVAILVSFIVAVLAAAYWDVIKGFIHLPQSH